MKIDKKTFLKLKKIIKKEERLQAKIASGSMKPLIQIGDVIEFVPTRLEDLKVFDIVVFWNGEMLICHYIWKISNVRFNHIGTRVVTRPLIATHDDFPFSPDRLLGKVTNFKIGPVTKIWIFLKQLRRS